MVKNPSANAGDAGDVSLIPGLGRSPGEGNGNPLQYSCRNAYTRPVCVAKIKKNTLVLTAQMKPGPGMGGPDKAFLLPHRARSAP